MLTVSARFGQDLFIDRGQEDAADARLRRSSRCSDDVTELSRQLSTIGGFIHRPTKTVCKAYFWRSV